MGPSRRDLLKTAAAGTAVAWAAPQLLSTAVAGAGTLVPPAFVSWAGAHDVTGGSLSITIGTGLNELNVTTGDFLLALAANHIDDTHGTGAATAGGWTLVGTQDARDPGGQNPGVRTRLFTHVVQAGDTGYTFSLDQAPPVGSTAWTLVIVGYSGAFSLSGVDSSAALTGDPSITVGPISPSVAQVTTAVLIGAENPVSPWTPAASYSQQVLYNPNNSVPEIYVADASLNVTPVPAATFTPTATNHPQGGWMVGVSPL